MIVIDFETRSEIDLTKVGAWVYSKHPSTEIICLSIKDLKERRAQLIPYWKITESIDILNKLAMQKLIAHNAFFEKCIWQNILHKRHGARPITEDKWRCTAAGARALGLPGKLELLCEAIPTKNKKDSKGHRLMLRMSKPRPKYTDLTDKWFENFEQLNDLFSYCIDDAEAEWEVAEFLEKHKPFSADEFRTWQFDQELNARGIPVDIESVEKIYDIMGIYGIDCEQELHELTDGQIKSVKQNVKSLAWLRVNGCDIPNLQAGTVETYLHTYADSMQPEVFKFLKLRQSLGRASTGKYEAFLNRTDRDDNRIRDTFVYHGAGPGRWSAMGLQPQNFPRGTIKNTDQVIEFLQDCTLDEIKWLYDDPMQVFSSCLRGMIKASPGKTFLASDFSAIEAKITMWLANDYKGLRAYRNNEDLYKVMAGYIYGIDSDKVTKDQRQLGKAAVLGCGFGMGWKKFKETASKPPYNVKMTDELAQTAVNTYRTTFKAVPQMWANLNLCAMRAFKDRKIQVTNKTRWEYLEPFLFCHLPSGRRMAYPFPSIKPTQTSWGESRLALHYWGIDSYTRKWSEHAIYGGLVAENVVQATARDVMKDAMLRVNPDSPVILTVHDEVISEVDEATANLTEFNKLMSIKPTWASDCPISVEGWQNQRYKK